MSRKTPIHLQMPFHISKLDVFFFFVWIGKTLAMTIFKLLTHFQSFMVRQDKYNCLLSSSSTVFPILMSLVSKRKTKNIEKTSSKALYTINYNIVQYYKNETLCSLVGKTSPQAKGGFSPHATLFYYLSLHVVHGIRICFYIWCLPQNMATTDDCFRSICQLFSRINVSSIKLSENREKCLL